MKKFYTFIVSIIFSIITVSAQGIMPEVVTTDTIASATAEQPVVKKRNLYQRIKAYFDDANKPTKASNKPIDINFIGGPYYSSEVKFGIGVVASGFYRMNRTDTTTHLSNISITAKASITGFLSMGIHGVNIFPGESWRLLYDFDVDFMPTYYWGIGYDACSNEANKTKYTDLKITVRVSGLRRIGGNFYIGPAARLTIDNANRQSDPDRWIALPQHIRSFGLGADLLFDTRDNFTAPTRGVKLQLSQLCYPRFLGNGNWSMSMTDLDFTAYQRLWRGAVLAERLHGRWAYGNVSWNMMSMMGGSDNMRGYYEGQYRDKFEADLTVELRQHVWRRNGLALWAGIAAVADRPSEIKWNEKLPCVGLGYRWEFKRNSNVRVDVGIGHHSKAFVFAINEAF